MYVIHSDRRGTPSLHDGRSLAQRFPNKIREGGNQSPDTIMKSRGLRHGLACRH